MFICLTIVSCSWEDENYGLGVKPENSSISLTGGTLFLDIKSNTQWSVSTNEEWITVMPDSGVGDGELIVLVSEAKEPREGKIYFSLPGGKKKETVIYQGKEEGFIELLFKGIYQDGIIITGGFVVLANQPWTLECEDWIKASPRHSNKYKTEVEFTVTDKTGPIIMMFEFKLENGTSVFTQWGTTIN